MTLDQIINAERQGSRAIRAIRPFLATGEDKAAMERAEFTLSEARHFAVVWEDIRTREDDGDIGADTAREERTAAINRLALSLAPQRM